MQNKLLPCPFCGGEAKLIKHFVVALDTEYRQVFCTSCCAKRPAEKFFTEEEAIKHWNTRKPMEQIVKQLEAELYSSEKYIREYDDSIEQRAFHSGIGHCLNIVKEMKDNEGWCR